MAPYYFNLVGPEVPSHIIIFQVILFTVVFFYYPYFLCFNFCILIYMTGYNVKLYYFIISVVYMYLVAA